jgi:hypothetical protein
MVWLVDTKRGSCWTSCEHDLFSDELKGVPRSTFKDTSSVHFVFFRRKLLRHNIKKKCDIILMDDKDKRKTLSSHPIAGGVWYQCNRFFSLLSNGSEVPVEVEMIAQHSSSNPRPA